MRHKIKRIITFLVLLGLSVSGTHAQTYHKDDKEGLRTFLRQLSASEVEINAERLGLSLSDTANWDIDETWVSKIINLYWNTDNPKRLIAIGDEYNHGWRNRGLAGSLDASKWKDLERLWCYNNFLTALDISANSALYKLECNNNRLTALDVSACPALEYLICDENQLTALDISACEWLRFLYCNNNKLVELDASANTSLYRLYCHRNQLTSLNVSGCTALRDLVCSENYLTELDLCTNIALVDLQCGDNQLISLDISTNTALKWVSCYNNQLAVLNISKNKDLETFNCNNNQLIYMDLTGLNAMTHFWGSDQSVPLTLYNDGSGIYTRLITLNSPMFDEIAITYADGKLQSTNDTVSSTSFTAETNKNGFQLEGIIYLTYLEEQPTPPTISTTNLPNGTVYVPYNQVLTASGEAIIWSIVSGYLPKGLTLKGDSISGTPWEQGVYNFTVKAKNNAGEDTKALSIVIGTVGIETISSFEFRIYPNPTGGQLFIECEDFMPITIKFYDMLGKEVLTQNINGKTEINISHLPNGIYNVTVFSKDKVTRNRKIVKRL